MKTNCWLTNKYIAHRGLFDNKTMPENSLAAFENAVLHGFAIELDVQMTADGELIVFHDYTLERMTNGSGEIEKLRWDEIKDLSLLGTNCKIPTLQQTLDTIDGKTEILLEIKSHASIGALEQKVADTLANYNGTVAIESFNPIIIRWFKKHYPQYMRGHLSSNMKEAPIKPLQKFLLQNLLLCGWSGSQFVAYNVDYLPNKRVTKLGRKMPILAWTIKSQEQHQQTKQHYDNIIFDSFVPQTDNL